jgi:hypothetical protein
MRKAVGVMKTRRASVKTKRRKHVAINPARKTKRRKRRSMTALQRRYFGKGHKPVRSNYLLKGRASLAREDPYHPLLGRLAGKIDPRTGKTLKRKRIRKNPAHLIGVSAANLAIFKKFLAAPKGAKLIKR